MDVTRAKDVVLEILLQAFTRQGQIIFDEVFITHISDRTITLRAHFVPEYFPKRIVKSTDFRQEVAPIQEQLFQSVNEAVGCHHVVPEASGSDYDAFFKAGASSFIIFNHTELSMAEIAARGNATENVAEIFALLTDIFSKDPVVD